MIDYATAHWLSRALYSASAVPALSTTRRFSIRACSEGECREGLPALYCGGFNSYDSGSDYCYPPVRVEEYRGPVRRAGSAGLPAFVPITLRVLHAPILTRIVSALGVHTNL